jgi:hypothetical protein
MDLTNGPQVLWRKGPCVKVLSRDAREIIRAALADESNGYANRADRHEPPYMAPSDDPRDYPDVRVIFLSPMVWLTDRKVVLYLQRLWPSLGPLRWLQGRRLCEDSGDADRMSQVGRVP